MDFENFFYVILAVIYILSRVLKARKRQPKETYQEPETDTPKKPVSFEDLLKGFGVDQEEDENEPEPVVEEEQEENQGQYEPQYSDEESKSIFEKSIKEAEKVTDYSQTEESKDLISKKFKPYQKEEDSDDFAEKIKDMLRSDEGSKKAIILSEILNRKY